MKKTIRVLVIIIVIAFIAYVYGKMGKDNVPGYFINMLEDFIMLIFKQIHRLMTDLLNMVGGMFS